MVKYFLEISFNGAAYHGWQTQPNALAVQQVVDEKLSHLLGHSIESVGCGRTDTGVHARQFFLHFISGGYLSDTNDFLFRLNCMLPHDIAALGVWEVKEEAHARFDAISRTYHYHLHFKKDPFLLSSSWFYPFPLDLTAMKEAAGILKEYNDFAAFCKSGANSMTTICKLESADFKLSEDAAVFEIKADRFLRNMVRAVMGTLIEVGKGRMTKDELREVILSKDRRKAGLSVPAHGLYLQAVEYPFELTR